MFAYELRKKKRFIADLCYMCYAIVVSSRPTVHQFISFIVLFVPLAKIHIHIQLYSCVFLSLYATSCVEINNETVCYNFIYNLLFKLLLFFFLFYVYMCVCLFNFFFRVWCKQIFMKWVIKQNCRH